MAKKRFQTGRERSRVAGGRQRLGGATRGRSPIVPVKFHIVRVRKPRMQFEWADAISERQWQMYRLAIETMRSAEIPFLLGGGFALATYTGRWRNTKDIDFYVLRRDGPKAAAALTRAGFADYYPKLAYDRKWIYRSIRSGVLVDIIWAMANQRAQVDAEWFAGAPSVSVRSETLKVVPLEEFLWCKLYILQRDHCDWTDILNLLYAAGPVIDWDHVIERLGEDVPLLRALLTVYDWLCPKRSRLLPERLRKMLGLPLSPQQCRSRYNRIRLLDSRGWFAAILPKNKPLEI
jgi:hypothetical protein